MSTESYPLPGGWTAEDLSWTEGPEVCVTHRRYAPCRRGPIGCRLSYEPDEVRMVDLYQRGIIE